MSINIEKLFFVDEIIDDRDEIETALARPLEFNKKQRFNMAVCTFLLDKVINPSHKNVDINNESEVTITKHDADNAQTTIEDL